MIIAKKCKHPQALIKFYHNMSLCLSLRKKNQLKIKVDKCLTSCLKIGKSQEYKEESIMPNTKKKTSSNKENSKAPFRVLSCICVQLFLLHPLQLKYTCTIDTY